MFRNLLPGDPFKGPRHAAPSRLARRLTFAAATAGLTAAAMGVTAQPAPTTVSYLRPAAQAATMLTPAAVTCRAFYAWDRSRTPARMNTLVTASTWLPRGWLKADTAQLYAVTSRPRLDTGLLGDAATQVNEDCGG